MGGEGKVFMLQQIATMLLLDGVKSWQIWKIGIMRLGAKKISI